MGVFTDDEITPLVVASVPFLGGITALMMVAVLMVRVNKAPSGEGAQIAIANQISRGRGGVFEDGVRVLGAVRRGGRGVHRRYLGKPRRRADVHRRWSTVSSLKKGGWQTMICFLVGAALSASAGWAGMSVATKTNVKTMEAARSGLNQALQIAFAGGAVMGFSVVAFGILGLTVLFYIFAARAKLSGTPLVVRRPRHA